MALILPVDEIVRLAAVPDRLTILCVATRPGALRYLVTLEEDHFPPRTPANDDYVVHTLDWQGLTWVAAFVPRAKRPEADRAGVDSGMRLVHAAPFALPEGVAVVTGAVHRTRRDRVPSGAVYFPADHDGVYTLEGDPTSTVYRDRDVIDEERRWLVERRARSGRR